MNRDQSYFNNRPSKWFFIASICLAAVSVLFLASCGREEKQAPEEVVRPVKIMTIASNDGVSGLRLPGKVRAARRVELAFKVVGGRLIELPIQGKEGTEVKEGDLLARIDPKDFQTEVRNVEGRLRETQAALKLAKSEYERIQRIRKEDPGAASEAMVKRRLEAANRSQGSVKSLNASLDNAKNLLSYTYLRAPFAGVIAKRYVDNFQEVKPKQPIVALEDISNVEILVDVPENLMAIPGPQESDKGIKAVAQFPTNPDKQYPLELKEYATKADPATQTYQVVLQMPQPEGLNLFPGMTATVVISSTEEGIEGSSILIPAIAVVADPDGKSYVWVVDTKAHTVLKRDVKVGRLTGSEDIQILEGLQGGEKIAVAGVFKLKDGMKVSIWDE